MNIKTAIAAAAIAAPAVLLSGTGVAQAGTSVNPSADALGVSVDVQSVGGMNASHGWCTYTATPAVVPAGVLPPLPVYNVPFYLEKSQNYRLWFPGIQTGTKWDVNVHCANGTDSGTAHPVY